MNEDKNELSDIKLQRDNSSSSKKIILSVATLGAIMLLTIIIINSLSSKKADNLPKRVPPPELTQSAQPTTQEPLFEEVEVEHEGEDKSLSLGDIAKKLKDKSSQESQESQESSNQVAQQAPVPQKEQPQALKQQPKKAEPTKTQETPKAVQNGSYYIQIGSFERVKPSQKILDATTKLGYSYTFHEVTMNDKKINKVLVGPFNSQKDARDALPAIKNSIEKNAFITKI